MLNVADQKSFSWLGRVVRFLLPVLAAGDKSKLVSVSVPLKSSVSVAAGETVSTKINEADGDGDEGGEPPESPQSTPVGASLVSISIMAPGLLNGCFY